MLCACPITLNNSEQVPCGQCINCRINTRRKWTGRLIAESYGHQESTFVTLTYTEDDLPIDGNLSRRDLRNFINYFRKKYHKYRYYAVGEYGSAKGRAHYHLVMFGIDPYKIQDQVKDIWKKGRIQIDPLSPELIAYICGYVVKKVMGESEHRENFEREQYEEYRRANENALISAIHGDEHNPLPYQSEPVKQFAVMSLKPWIGFKFYEGLAKSLNSKKGARFIQQNGDVPSSIRLDGKVYPVPRIARDYLREQLCVDNPQPKQLDYDSQEYIDGLKKAKKIAAKKFKEINVKNRSENL